MNRFPLRFGQAALGVALLLTHPASGQETGSIPLAAEFASPPDSARPWVWGHWLDGNVDKPSITRNLEAIRRVGLGGVTMFDVAQPGIPRGPHPYFSPGWQEMFAWEIQEAKRLGLEVMSQNGPGYSGNGGPWISPEFASQKIVESATRVPGGKKFSGVLPQPVSQGGYYRDVAVLAISESQAQADFRIEDFDMKRLVWLNYIRWKGTRSAPPDARAPEGIPIPATQILDLTAKMREDGMLVWDAPPGQWTVLRFGHTWTGQKTLPAPPDGEGPECDKLDKRGIQRHFQHVMNRMVDLAGPEAGKTFHTFFVDSWEAGGQNWTAEMPAEFQRRRGYDIRPFLPVLAGRVVNDLQTTERFLFDLRRTVSELVAENFWAELQRLCHARGMRVAVQPYITTGQDLDAANFADEPTGEFWSHPFQPNDYRATVKLASSAANLNGRLIVGAEAFTASENERWLSHPATMKELGDQAFALGANRFQIHRFAMQRFPDIAPGMTMGKWGQHYDSTQTWWEWSRPWHDYLARCQYMLRRGPVVADVLAIVSEEPLHRFEHKPIPGHDYDVCGPDVFNRLVLQDGRPVIPGRPPYALLTVSHHGTMTLDRLKKLRDLVAGGAALLGDPPAATPGLENLPQADAELKKIALDLWGGEGESDRKFGRGRVFRGLSTDEALRRLGLTPAFTGPSHVSWIHRRADDAEIFFLATTSDTPTMVAATFRVSGMSAELWNPLDGVIRPLDLVSTTDGRATARIPLGPDGSAFVVFRSGSPGRRAVTSVAVNGTPVLPPALSSPPPVAATPPAAGNFAFGLWARPEAKIELPGMVTTGPGGIKNRRNDAVFPPPAHRILGGKNHAFAGVSIGTNGVVVYEHGSDHFPPVLVHRTPLTDWTHVAVAYHDGRSTLYLNGVPVRSGRSSGKSVHSPVGVKSDPPPGFRGQLGSPAHLPLPADAKTPLAWPAAEKPVADHGCPTSLLEEIGSPDPTGHQWLAYRSGEFTMTYSDGTSESAKVDLPAPIDLTGPWNLSFPEKSGAPTAITLPELICWTKHPDLAVRHFSGTGTYHRTFDLPPESAHRLFLDLGRVHVMARVSVNGQDLGILWNPPYRVDITRAARPGLNDLKIEVVNLWPNRLIGDAALPEDAERQPNGTLMSWPSWLLDGKSSPSGRRTFVTFPLWKNTDPLQPSGMLGPVRIHAARILP